MNFPKITIVKSDSFLIISSQNTLKRKTISGSLFRIIPECSLCLNFLVYLFKTFAEKTMGKSVLVILFFVACSTIGALNGALMGCSRY